MKKIFLAAILLGTLSAGAQFTLDYLKAADNYFNKADYASAATYYEKYLTSAFKKGDLSFNPYVIQKGNVKNNTTVSSKELATYRIAESYRMLHFPAKAEPWYRKVLEGDHTQFPLALYHQATMLRALERYQESEQAFTAFLAEYKTEDLYAEAARREVLNLKFIQAQLQRKDLPLYTVTKGGQGLNATGASYAPLWLNSSMLLFTSTRLDSGNTTKDYTNRIYQAVYSEGTAGAVNLAALPQDVNIHQGAASVSADGNTLYLTRWSTVDGKKNASIYSSARNGESWFAPVAMDALNVAGSNTQQPFAMADGKHLLFVSDREGGQGGLDIWMAELDGSGKVVATSNLGSGINTKYDEEAPYYHTASGTLVFSSKGRVGMGGYDFYYSKGSLQNLSAPENFGFPVNSVKDDLYFTSRGPAKNILQDVLFSSDRAADCCLELFSLNKIRPMKQVSGMVVACETGNPLPNILVTIRDTINNKTISTHTTDAEGRYTFTIEDYQPLKAVATAKGYLTNSQEIDSPLDPEALVMSNRNICLAKPVTVLDNVYYEFSKATLLDESFASLDKIVHMMTENPTMQIEISGHTDSKGDDELNRILSEARAQSVVDYLVSKGIDASRLQAKGYGASRPVAPNKKPNGTDNPEGRQKNRRTEFQVLHY